MACGPAVAAKGGAGGFLFGVGAGVLLHKYWPTITKTAKPLADTALSKGKKIFESGKDVFKSRPERFDDVIQEIKRDEAKKGERPEPTT